MKRLSKIHKRLRRDESGLTTLEWLLIVAAVAGLAALAVVLVTNVVNDTSEQISGSDSRQTSARLAADEILQEILSEARTANRRIDNDATIQAADKPARLTSELNRLNGKYQRRCENLRVLYSDIEGISFTWRNGDTGNINRFQDSRTTNSPIRSPECIFSP